MKEIFTKEKNLMLGIRYQNRGQYYGTYTVAFIVFAIICYWPFFH